MTDLSTITEEQLVISKDKLTAIRYKVVAETIDLQALKAEKENLEAELNQKEPSDKELIETGKMMHPFYMLDREYTQRKIDEINSLLEV
jgi:hypothetical protein